MLRAAGSSPLSPPLKVLYKEHGFGPNLLWGLGPGQDVFPMRFYRRWRPLQGNTCHKQVEGKRLKPRLVHYPMSTWRWTKSSSHLCRNAILSDPACTLNCLPSNLLLITREGLPVDTTRGRSAEPQKFHRVNRIPTQKCHQHRRPHQQLWLLQSHRSEWRPLQLLPRPGMEAWSASLTLGPEAHSGR